MRNLEFAPDEHYHLCNRGVRKQNIFLNDNDRARFLYLILAAQSLKPLSNIAYQTRTFKKTGSFALTSTSITELVENRFVALVSFILMSNHFHLIVREIHEGGISKYMMRVLDAYTKYFNTKYEQSGHLFQGPFRAVHIKNNGQLLYASAYVHRNAGEILKWRGQDEKYPWSSYPDYFEKNRWQELLKPEIVLGQFKNGVDYHDWCTKSGAKSKNKLGEEYLDELA